MEIHSLRSQIWWIGSGLSSFEKSRSFRKMEVDVLNRKELPSTWMDILKAVRSNEDIDPNFKSSFVRNVACGDNTSFWHDPWCMNDMVLMKAFPRYTPRGRAIDDLSSLVSFIGNTSLSSSGCDKWFWTYDSSASLNRLATRVNLLHRGIHILSVVCPLCGLVNEDVNHALLTCSRVLPILRKVWSWWSLALSVSLPSFSISNVACGNLIVSGDSAIAKILHGIFQIGIWILWNWRNRVMNAPLDKIDKVKVEDVTPQNRFISLNDDVWIRWKEDDGELMVDFSLDLRERGDSTWYQSFDLREVGFHYRWPKLRPLVDAYAVSGMDNGKIPTGRKPNDECKDQRKVGDTTRVPCEEGKRSRPAGLFAAQLLSSLSAGSFACRLDGSASQKKDELIRSVNTDEIRVYENVDEISAGEKGEIRDEENVVHVEEMNQLHNKNVSDSVTQKDDLNTYCVSNDDKDDFDVVTDTNVDHEEKTEGEVKSYANDVQKNDNNVDTSFEYKPTEISEDGTEFVIFDEEIVAKGSEKWKLTIRGQFVGCYMYENELRYHIKRMWGKYGVIDVQMDRQGICYFKFRSNEGLERVLEQGPWIVNNKPLYVQKWNPIIKLEKVDATKILVWAKLINIQLEAWSKEGISALASSLGKPLRMDNVTAQICKDGKGIADFARVLVEFDASKGLKDEICVQYRSKDNVIKGTKKVKVEYMWKPEVCSTCKVFGHGNEKCKKGQKDPTQNVTESGNIGRSKESVNEGNYMRNYEVRRDNHVGFNQMKGGWRNVGYRNGTYRRKENNKDVREYQQKKVMENIKEEQGRTLHDDIVDAINKSPNKFDVSVEDNERQELNMLKYRIIYFKMKWEEDRLKEKEDLNKENEDVMDGRNDAARRCSANVISGMDTTVLN
ncbi:RNA-directed DNA polymerase, eukaryota, reverse transcriptase zinc-binding domain protein [Tanacetum coccineum]